MKISGCYTVPFPREQTYALLLDPVVLARCLPGCDELERTGQDEYRMKMKMVLASLSGLFDGTVSLAEQNPPESFKLIVEGNGKIGFMKGEGLLSLAPDSEVTSVSYEGDVHVGGTIAGVGQRLLDTTARLMIKKFFKRLSENPAEEAP